MTAITAATNGIVSTLATPPKTAFARSKTKSLSRPAKTNGSASSPTPHEVERAAECFEPSCAFDEQRGHRDRPRGVEPDAGDDAGDEGEQQQHAMDERQPQQGPESSEAEPQRRAPVGLRADVRV